jgi:hypothetical protein
VAGPKRVGSFELRKRSDDRVILQLVGRTIATSSRFACGSYDGGFRGWAPRATAHGRHARVAAGDRGRQNCPRELHPGLAQRYARDPTEFGWNLDASTF